MTKALSPGTVRNLRRAANGMAILGGIAVTVLAGRHFSSVGWPLKHADVGMAVAAGVVFLGGYGLKAYGWKLLFVPGQRPGAASLAAAGGAASITGIALPGRFDDVVRIAIVRRHRGCPAGVKALMLSLVTLALVDTVALMPLAVSASVFNLPILMRLAFMIVALGGVLAAIAIVAIPSVARRPRLLRFRLVSWFCAQAPSPRAAFAAIGFVTASWIVRTVGVLLMLASVGLGFSLTYAIIFLCAGAASAALPIAPGGAATQTGAGAGALVAAGVTLHRAVEFAVAAQVVVIIAGVAALIAATLWNGAVRYAAHRSAVNRPPAIA